jgi:hypothetical protein
VRGRDKGIQEGGMWNGIGRRGNPMQKKYESQDKRKTEL